MNHRCELLDQCGFFSKYTTNMETVKQGWIRLFCEDSENSQMCERKKYRAEHGKPPDDNVSPIGSLL